MSTATEPIRSAKLDPHIKRVLILAIIFAALLRLGLAAVSRGSNDAVTWEIIANHVADHGLLQSYRDGKMLNHPPLAILWSRLSLAVGSDAWFSVVMKLPAIAADLAACALVTAVWMKRGDPRRARLAAAAMALSPVAILVSGYHCNTDNVYAFFSLLSAYLIAEHRRFFLGGLALGAAINIKLIPVLLIPGMLSLSRSWREAMRLLGGLALAAIPFVPLLIEPENVRRNMLAYVPPISDWGVAYFLHNLYLHPPFAAGATWMMDQYLWLGRGLIIVGVVALAVASRRLRAWNAYELAALSYLIFLVLTPGFGPQYTTAIVPLLVALSISRAWIYGILAGGFLLLAYWAHLKSFSIPLLTVFPENPPSIPGTTFGLLAWWVLLELAVTTLVLRRDDLPRTADTTAKSKVI